MAAKLETEPIEDLRIDLEDGYGTRPDEEEDRHAQLVGLELAAAVTTGIAPPFLGIRFKSLEPATRRRGLRTLDLVLRALLDRSELPAGWVLTLPKVTSVAQVTAMVDICGRLESAYGLAEGALRFEIQVETPQAVLLADGTAGVAAMLHAAAGRCAGLHFGTYDYTASLEIAGGYQSLDHPAADHAKAVMQLAAAGTGVPVSDGSANQHPGRGRRGRVRRLGPARPAGPTVAGTRVLPGVGLASRPNCRPGSSPPTCSSGPTWTRWAPGSAAYLHRSGGGVLDEPATARALAGFLLRGVHCGAIGAGEIPVLTGADLQIIATLAAPHSRPDLRPVSTDNWSRFTEPPISAMQRRGRPEVE